MAKVLLSNTEAVQLIGTNRAAVLIQNRSGGNVYMDNTDEVSADTGFVIEAGGVYETAGAGANGAIWLIAANDDAEIRVLGARVA